jgi:S-DNA-T family DNA segregation ATPase FtsK/SpoIIIE
MKLKLTLAASGQRDDIELTADGSALIGDITDRIRISHPTAQIAPTADGYGVTVNPGTSLERAVAPETHLGESGIRSGDVISVSPATRGAPSTAAPVATLNVLSGPTAPATLPLQRGTNLVGRDRSADVRIDDPLISKRHAKVNISDMVELIDDGSANGIVISGQVVDRAVLNPGGTATLGDTTISITLHTTAAAETTVTTPNIEFNRSPRLDPQYEGVELKAPTPPKPPQPRRFPIMSLLAPILMGGIIFFVTQRLTSLIVVAMGPVMAIGGYFESRVTGKKDLERSSAIFRSALLDLSVQLQYAAGLERVGRRKEHPSAPEILEAVGALSPLTWTRRPEHDSFMKFRVGLGTQPSRNTVELPSANDTVPELWRELLDVVSQFKLIDRVPIVTDFRDVGNVGVAGPDAAAWPSMANVLGQMVGLHSPAELIVAGVAADASQAWDWLKWLPHVGSEFSPLESPHLAANSAEATTLVAAIEDLIETRIATEEKDSPMLPRIVVFVHDSAPVERARLVQIAERGPAAGVHVAWLAGSVHRLPAACRVFIEPAMMDAPGSVGFVKEAFGVEDLEPERIEANAAIELARRIAPVVDSGTRTDSQSDIPRTVSFLTLAGVELAEGADPIVELWRANNSIPGEQPVGRKRPNSLRALVGQSAEGPMHLDLRTQGPHALVGGTTGAGKSEFLQSWVLGMASMHSPSRVTFLFVDYKGGAAFADCVDLPHNVGLVTDLSPHLVRRALTSPNAELRHREHVLNDKKAKDLIELERRGDPECPPSLVIVVDEFAALVAEVPEFVDGVVNVAQRGRSLGLHLILATQRPAGVIKDNLRANTNLRVALRMADEADSTDVIGTPVAGGFDPAIPGRGVAKTGPGRLAAFQSAYVGGRTSRQVPKPSIGLRTLEFGSGTTWDEPELEASASSSDNGPNDIKRVVSSIVQASAQLGLAAPRQPWMPELAEVYRLEQLPTRRTDDELVFGVMDDPEAQEQPEVAFYPETDGNMAVYGTGGSGKSTFLRSIAVAAAFAPARGGPCHIFGLDFSGRGLSMLEPMPHVGSIIPGEDTERVTRLLRELREKVSERAERFSKVNAATLSEYRTATSNNDEERIIVLVDGIGPFRTAYEATSLNAFWEVFQSLISEGRGVGVHFVVSADRPAAVSSSLSSAIQQRLVLRLATEMDYIMVDAPADGFSETSPPGRGFANNTEVQVAVVGGDANVSVQAAEIERLAGAMNRAGVVRAKPVESLAEMIPLSSLPVAVGGQPTLGVWDQTLQPVGFDPTGIFLVSGPPASGRTTTLATMVSALTTASPEYRTVYVGQRRSPLALSHEWTEQATNPLEIDEMCRRLLPELAKDDDAKWVVVIESVGELLNTECDMSLQDVLKACRANDHFVIAEGETSTLTGSWPLLQAVKVSRSGIALQPDQIDGDALFKTSFPRVARADFSQGRGLFVVGGKFRRVQVALPE